MKELEGGTGKLVLAKSAKQILPGQQLLVFRSGAVVRRPRALAVGIQAGILAVMFGGLISGAYLALHGSFLIGSLLYLVGYSPSYLFKRYGVKQFNDIEKLLRLGKLDEAQQQLAANPDLERRNPTRYRDLAGSLASHRGDHVAAVASLRRVVPHRKAAMLAVHHLKITGALLLSGELELARRERAQAVFPPDIDEVLFGIVHVEILFALHDPTFVITEEHLHDRARQLLEYSHTGHDLAALGMLFDRRGDDDMARFLAAEARERMHYLFLATWWPALQQWLDEKAPVG